MTDFKKFSGLQNEKEIMIDVLQELLNLSQELNNTNKTCCNVG
jgi:hypothetical protein